MGAEKGVQLMGNLHSQFSRRREDKRKRRPLLESRYNFWGVKTSRVRQIALCSDFLSFFFHSIIFILFSCPQLFCVPSGFFHCLCFGGTCTPCSAGSLSLCSPPPFLRWIFLLFYRTVSRALSLPFTRRYRRRLKHARSRRRCLAARRTRRFVVSEDKMIVTLR